MHLCGITANPTEAWVTQQARNLTATLEDQGGVVRNLIRDRDTKFTRSFDDVWAAIGTHVIRTPNQAPNGNAYAERWVGTVRRECLDHLLIAGPRHLERVLTTYVKHYNGHRPHRALQLLPPRPSPADDGDVVARTGPIKAATSSAGLIHEYRRAA